MDPERELWSAVLQQAISDFVGNVPKYENRETVQRRATRWFTSTRIGAGSFHWICQNLGLDEAAVRHGLFRTPTREIVIRLRNYDADPYSWRQLNE
jgi:hypothetical protein